MANHNHSTGRRRRRSQPRLFNPRGLSIPRIPSYTGLEPRLKDWVIREARYYGVSPAFVMANCISFASGIPVTYDYKDKGTK